MRWEGTLKNVQLFLQRLYRIHWGIELSTGDFNSETQCRSATWLCFMWREFFLMTSGNYASLSPSPDRCWTWHRTERKERRTYMLSIRPTDHFLLKNVENLIQLGDSKICDSQVSLKKEKKLFIRRMCARFVNCCSVLVRPKWIMSKAVRRLSKVWVSFYCFVDLISEWLTAKVICEKKKS